MPAIANRRPGSMPAAPSSPPASVPGTPNKASRLTGGEVAEPAARSQAAAAVRGAASPAPKFNGAALHGDLRASMVDAGFYNIMVGLGESYFPAFALALGLGEGSSGLMATLPVLLGATLQLFTPWALRRFSSNRRWVVAGASIQAFAVACMPLAAIATGSWVVVLAFGLATFYHAGCLATSPAWNVWMEDVIPRSIRNRFFGKRGRFGQFALVLGFCAGGFALQWGRSNGLELPVFAGLFVLAGVARAISAGHISQQSEPRGTDGAYKWVSPLELFRSRGATSGGSMVLFLLCLQMAVQTSGPFFAPFLLGEKGYDYTSFLVLMGVTFVAKTVAMPYWGRVAQRIGPERLLWIGAASIVPVASLWVALPLVEGTSIPLTIPLPGGAQTVSISGAMVFIFGVQTVSGFVWAAFELAMALMFFAGIPRERRGYMLTWYNWGNAAAMCAGSVVGATFLRTFGETEAAYITLFALSSVLRLLVVGGFALRRRWDR